MVRFDAATRAQLKALEAYSLGPLAPGERGERLHRLKQTDASWAIEGQALTPEERAFASALLELNLPPEVEAEAVRQKALRDHAGRGDVAAE